MAMLSDEGNTPSTSTGCAAAAAAAVVTDGEDMSFSHWCYEPKLSDSKTITDICKLAKLETFGDSYFISGSEFEVLMGSGYMFMRLSSEGITVDYKDMCVSLSLGLREQLEIKSQTLAGHTLRYVVLGPENCQGMKSLKLSGYVVMLSALVNGEVVNMYLRFEDVVQAVNAVNAFRRLIYISSGNNNCLLQTLQPYVFSQVFVSGSLEKRALHTPMYILLDEQSLMLYKVKATFADRPVVRLTFHDNDARSPTITGSMFVDGCLEITAQNVSLLLGPASYSEESKMVMDKVCDLMLNVIKTKACDIFSATPEGTRPSGWQEHLSRLQQPQFDWTPERKLWDVKLALVKSSVNLPGFDDLLSDSDTERPSTSAASAREEVWERKDLTDIFTKPKDISKHSDMMQTMWVVAEDEMSTILEDGLVPSSSIKSVGLDENSFEHFERCVDEIQEALLNQRYDQALSHIRGLQQIFRESKTPQLREVSKMHEVKIARCIYFAVQ